MATPTSPAYLWYPKDAFFSGRMAELSATEECWYRRALDRCWMDGGVPADAAKCAKRIGKGCTAKAAQMLLDMFFQPHKKDPSLMINDRLEKERKKFAEKSKVRSAAGKESGRKRRERKQLGAEQMFDSVQTKTNIPIPIPISFSSPIDLKRLIDRAIVENSKKDPRLVEVAILETLMNREGSTEPINSMQYFAPHIKKITGKSSGISPETIDVLLTRRREQMAKTFELRAVA